VLDDFREIVLDTWHYRDLLLQMTLRDVRIRYKQAVMGFAWAIFMPLLIVAAGALIRSALAYASDVPFDRAQIAAIALKALPWSFVVGAVGFATGTLSGNMQLVTKVYFPREVLPLSAVLAQLFDLSVGSAALVVALPFLGAQLSLQLLWVPMLVLMLIVFTTGICLFLACANLFFRDVKYIVQVLITFGIFFTPVFFEPAALGPRTGDLLALNPLTPVLEGLRLAVLESHNLLTPLTDARGTVVWEPWYLAYGWAWAVVVLVGSSLIFHRSEFKFAEYV
jgi:ABC-type polysaccharide/polyol phosphate export permease